MSGGPDSVFLYYFLKEIKEKYNLQLYFAHINHMLRSEDSDNDSEFVKKLGKDEGIETFILKKNIELVAKEKKISIEEAGRFIRYNFFEEVKSKVNGTKIALAHNLDDNVETFLFRLMRGTKLDGLCSIQEKREYVIRPIMSVYKKDILNYLNKNSYRYQIDRTNNENIYTRNKIRLDLIPYIEKNYNINFKEKIVNLIEEINQTEEFISENINIKDYIFENRINYLKIKNKSKYIKLRLIKDYLKQNNINYNHNKISDIYNFLNLENGTKDLRIDKKYLLVKEYNEIYLKKINNYKEIEQSVILKIGEKKTFKKYAVSAEIIEDISNLKLIKDKNVIYLDYNKLSNKLEFKVRKRQNGDVFNPKGLIGRKKLKDYLINSKIPKYERDNIPIITNNDDIIWIGGLREVEGYSINEHTKKAVLLQLKKSD